MKTRLALCIMTLIIVLSSASLTVAASPETTRSPEQTLQEYVSSQNARDWDAMASLEPDDRAVLTRSFFAQKDNAGQGIFDITGAELVHAKQIPLGFAGIGERRSLKDVADADIKVYYVAINYSIPIENKYVHNGLNYRLAILVKDGKEWRVRDFEGAPVNHIVARGLGFGGDHEKQEADRITALASQTSSAPSSINLLLGNEENCQAYFGEPCWYGVHVVTIPFTDYQKDVLPNEWWNSPIPHAEAQKAGAMAVKMYGWYHVEVAPKWPNYGAECDDTTNCQVYLLNSRTSPSNTVGAHIV
ncbi:MAG TPA: SpoIID/LytB domain-containing protein [Symbiobacteriaceae bacterium]|nr:SpoIID/LytB domain-containing protein [Symbiobacteriaceae bacterium]